MFGKKFTMVIPLFICVCILANPVCAAKSVFIISAKNYSAAKAYRIDGNLVTFQATANLPHYGSGSIALAAWPQKELMFIDYDSSSVIVWVSTKTLEKVGEFNTGVPYNPNMGLCGIAVDTVNRKIYVVNRGTPNLYVYSLNDSNSTLIPDAGNPHPLSPSVTNAYGIALDETNGRLYVSDDSNIIHYYSTTNWAYQGSFNIVVGSNNRPAVGVAVDPARGYLYSGRFDDIGNNHQYLVKTLTSSPYTSTETSVGTNYAVLGIDVDKDTGLVYCTVTDKTFRVYNNSLTLLDTKTNVSSPYSGTYPSGVAVGSLYKTHNLKITKTDNSGGCAYPYNEIDDNYLTYSICYDANGYADTNVVVVDQLPAEVDFYSASDGYTYDPENRTVTWHPGNLSPTSTGCYQLVVKVNEYAQPGNKFTNTCTIEGDNYYKKTTLDTNVCNWGGDIIYVDKDATGYNNGTNWDDAYTDLQYALTAAQRLVPDITAIWVAAGTYKPAVQVDPGEAYKDKSFELLQNVALIGHFGGIGTYETSPDQRNLADATKTTTLDGKIGANYWEGVYNVVKATNISNALVDGFTVTGGYSDNTSGIYLNDADVSIANSRFETTDYGTQATMYSYPDIHNCTFFNNKQNAFYTYSYCQPGLSYCTFDGNGAAYYGIYMSYNCATTIKNSIFKNYTYIAIYGTSNGTLSITDSQVFNNAKGFDLMDITTSLSGCKITNNNGSGIVASDSDITMLHCLLENNREYSVSTQNGCNITFERSIIRRNGYNGLNLNGNLTTTIKNCWINKNGTRHSSFYGGAGIYLAGPAQTPLIRNDTIYDNWTYGIQANLYGPDPNVRNCIVYGNDVNDLFRETGGDPFAKVNYCCLQNSHSGQGNFVANPMFTNTTDPNDLHIDDDSLCVDTGDPCGVYADEKDIDDEPRNDGRLDIGADENFWSKADYNEDGTVNFLDYCTFAAAWRKTNAQVSLDSDTDVDYIDLALFCRDWLWQRQTGLGWMQSVASQGGGGSESMAMMTMAAADDESIITDVPVSADNTLMITDVQTSKALMPQRLARRTDAFYAITAESAAAWKSNAAAPVDSVATSNIEAAAPVDVNELTNWLDEVWLTGELNGIMTESEYLEFRNTIGESGEQVF